MIFEIQGKVAIITGAAAGLGYRYAEEFLKSGIGGITIADFDEEAGKRAEKELNQKYEQGKVLFVKTDVSDKQQFDNSFQKTVERFKFVDILINNAGIMNDSVWEKEIDINFKGTVNGVILGLENYLQNYRQGDTSLILNISSVAGLKGYAFMPVYVGTKAAVVGLTQGWATPFHYNRTKVRMVVLCPGSTNTELLNTEGRFLMPEYQESVMEATDLHKVQDLDVIAEELVKIVKFAENGTIWVVEYDQPAYEYKLGNRQEFAKQSRNVE